MINQNVQADAIEERRSCVYAGFEAAFGVNREDMEQTDLYDKTLRRNLIRDLTIRRFAAAPHIQNDFLTAVDFAAQMSIAVNQWVRVKKEIKALMTDLAKCDRDGKLYEAVRSGAAEETVKQIRQQKGMRHSAKFLMMI